MKIKRLLVPLDFSANSSHALDYAADFAKTFKAELLVLHVVEPIYYAVPDFTGGAAAAMAGVLDEQRHGARAQLLQIERRYAKRRIKLRILLQSGSAYQAIVDTARRLKADMIVMTTHGRTGMSHLLMGSVAERVVRSATCPVLTLRAGKMPRRSAPKKRKR
jgi:nucleotide-binding universal stress UspA family protein